MAMRGRGGGSTGWPGRRRRRKYGTRVKARARPLGAYRGSAVRREDVKGSMLSANQGHEHASAGERGHRSGRVVLLAFEWAWQTENVLSERPMSSADAHEGERGRAGAGTSRRLGATASKQSRAYVGGMSRRYSQGRADMRQVWTK
ncbi:hypothetical protein FRC12_018755 [Ceratobasidium sp. 428]|nr:hypothetical protein FRC12_018755 [Ceratobasidium sp. 428]